MLSGGAAACAASALAVQAMAAPLWRGVDEVAVVCAGEAAALCAAALTEAARGSPVPVRRADAGPAGPGTLELRLDAVRSDGAPLLLTVSAARPASLDDAQGGLLPRTTRAASGERAEATIARALDRALPWRRAGARHPLARHPIRQSMTSRPVRGRSTQGE